MFDYDMEFIKESHKFRVEDAIRIWHGYRPAQTFARTQARHFIEQARRMLAALVERLQVMKPVLVTVDCAAFPAEC